MGHRAVGVTGVTGALRVRSSSQIFPTPILSYVSHGKNLTNQTLCLSHKMKIPTDTGTFKSQHGTRMCHISRHHCSIQFYIYLTKLSNSILCFCFQIVSQIFPWRGLGEEATMEEYIKWGLICITSTYAKAAFWTRYHFIIVFGTPVIMSVIG